MSYQDKYYEISKKYNHVGINTLLIKNGNIYTSSEGVKTLNEEEGLNINTIFRIASISKVVVALGIMKLYEQGLVDINEDVSKYLGFTLRNPNHPNIPITLRMIMTQTSSISDGNQESIGYDGVNGISEYVSLEDLLINKDSKYYYEHTYTLHKPGEHFEYSNFGCGILACIIERITGFYFSDFIRENVLLPLGLDASFKASDIIHKENIASLYSYNKNTDTFKLERNKEMFLKYEYPKFKIGDNFRMAAGGLFISIHDLSIIMQMFMNHGTYKNVKVFEETTIKFMKEIHWQGTSEDPDYYKKGLQLQILDDYHKDPIYGHFGNAYGLRSFMFFNDFIGIIFITNGANVMDNPKRGISDLQHETMNFMINYND